MGVGFGVGVTPGDADGEAVGEPTGVTEGIGVGLTPDAASAPLNRFPPMVSEKLPTDAVLGSIPTMANVFTPPSI